TTSLEKTRAASWSASTNRLASRGRRSGIVRATTAVTRIWRPPSTPHRSNARYMDQQFVIVIVLGVLCFGALAFVLLAPTQKDKAKKRLSAIDAGGRSARRGSAGAASTEREGKERRRKLTEALAKIDDTSKAHKK